MLQISRRDISDNAKHYRTCTNRYNREHQRIARRLREGMSAMRRERCLPQMVYYNSSQASVVATMQMKISSGRERTTQEPNRI